MQVYGGLVYMDFEEKHMKQFGRGRSAGSHPPVISSWSSISMPALAMPKPCSAFQEDDPDEALMLLCSKSCVHIMG